MVARADFFPMSKPLTIAFITQDSREELRDYGDPMPSFGSAPTALLQGFAGLPGCEIHIISCVQRPVASPEKIAENIYYHSVPIGKWGWMRGLYAGCVLAVRKKLREINPDIVHGQGTERYCAISAVFSGYPNVLTIHGNMSLVAKINHAPPLSFEWLAAHLESFTLPRTNGVVCITNYTRDAVAPLTPKTWVLPNATNAIFYDTKRAPVTPRKLVCVGTICSRKNQKALILALDSLAATLPFRLEFYGAIPTDASYGPEFLEMIASRPWCSHHNFIDHHGLRDVLSGAGALMLPSVEDNCPMVILEAMAAGVPVIASKVGGIPDLIEDGVTGILSDPHNPESMRAAVEKMLRDDAFAASVAARARALAGRFHPRTVAEKHLDIYREVLDMEMSPPKAV